MPKPARLNLGSFGLVLLILTILAILVWIMLLQPLQGRLPTRISN